MQENYDEVMEQDDEVSREVIRAETLEAIGMRLAKRRAEAISGRASSGIEEIWREDEEYYEGIDELNRGVDSWRSKPPGQVPANSGKQTQSTVFPNITGPFVDAASARIADMLLPADEKGWEIAPTPVPDLVQMQKGVEPAGMQALPRPEGAPVDPAFEKKALAQAAEEAISEARIAAERASDQIEDWLVHAMYSAECRKMIEDAAKVGTGIIKGPVPKKMRKRAYAGGAVKVSTGIGPCSRRLSYWNFWPDPSCGNNIHNGSYTWDMEKMSVREVKKLLDDETYLKDQLKLVLKEKPMEATGEVHEPEISSGGANEGRYEVWNYHGILESEDLEAIGAFDGENPIIDPELAENTVIDVTVTMINNRVVKFGMNPLDTGEFPYDVMCWRERTDFWAGIGVARQIRTAQKMVVGATRHLMDNAGIAAGPMLIFKQGTIYPADGVMGFAPRKIFYMAEDADTFDDVRKAIGTVKVDMVIGELMEIINLGMRFAEDTTGLPMLLQGQMGAAPETVGGMTMLNNNATAVLRRMARLFDDRVTVPHINRYYTWLLQYSDDDSQKGDFTVHARGSSALVERDIQAQEIANMATIVTDPRFGADPEKWFKEFLISRRYSPSKFLFDDEEKRKMFEQMAQPQPDSRVEIAKINAGSRENVAALNSQTKLTEATMEQQSTVAELEIKDRISERQEETKRFLGEMSTSLDAVIEEMKQAGLNDRSAQLIKEKIATTVAKLQTQKEMQAGQVINPPVEPRGRAPDGQSFQK